MPELRWQPVRSGQRKPDRHTVARRLGHVDAGPIGIGKLSDDRNPSSGCRLINCAVTQWRARPSRPCLATDRMAGAHSPPAIRLSRCDPHVGMIVMINAANPVLRRPWVFANDLPIAERFCRDPCRTPVISASSASKWIAGSPAPARARNLLSEARSAGIPASGQTERRELND